MTVPYRTMLALGVAVGLLGAGYAFAPQPGAAPLSTAPKVAAVAKEAPPAAPTAKPASTLTANRAPVPLAPRTHTTYYAPKPADPSVQTASVTAGPTSSAPTATDGATASATSSGKIDGGQPPSDDAMAGGGRQAKAAIEMDGYKGVRVIEKGADGSWRARAMRGRTEITVRVDASGNVSAE